MNDVPCSRFRVHRLPPTMVPSASPSWSTHQPSRSEEHTSELQSPCNLVCRLLLEKKKTAQQQRRASEEPVEDKHVRRPREIAQVAVVALNSSYPETTKLVVDLRGS